MMGYDESIFRVPTTIGNEYYFKAYAPSDIDNDLMLSFFANSTTIIHLLEADDYNEAISILNALIMHFIDGHANNNIEQCRQALLVMAYNCLRIAATMGVYYNAWEEFWNDVQRANMAKERATSVEQSKRKSTLDVIKPLLWEKPKTEEILSKYNDATVRVAGNLINGHK